jgi:hypothetical protein
MKTKLMLVVAAAVHISVMGRSHLHQHSVVVKQLPEANLPESCTWKWQDNRSIESF